MNYFGIPPINDFYLASGFFDAPLSGTIGPSYFGDTIQGSGVITLADFVWQERKHKIIVTLRCFNCNKFFLGNKEEHNIIPCGDIECPHCGEKG